MSNQWSTGLLACDKPLGVCLYAWLCPGCAYASARTEYDTSNWIFNVCCVTPSVARNIIREGYGIEGSAWGDIFVPAFCQPCVAAQLIQEVKNRGSVTQNKSSGEQWKNGICSFDCGLCLYACILPQCAIGNARNAYDGSAWCFNCCCVSPTLLRNIVREGYGIDGDCCTDMIFGGLLGICTIVQTQLEIRSRGAKGPSGGKMV